MAKKQNEVPMICQFFTWRLFRRDDVYYADGRSNQPDVGKHSLGTRDRDEAIERLRHLDIQKAVELGKIEASAAPLSEAISITDGWKAYLDHCARSPVLQGISASSQKRYRAVRDKHVPFCATHNIATWTKFDKASLGKYGNWLGESHADRTVFLELTLLKSVVRWLISEGRLAASAELRYPLRKPQGTSTFCYHPAQVSAMVEHCRNNPQLAWLGVVIIALAHSGLRISELSGLRWSDIDLDRGTMRVADERANRKLRTLGVARTTKGRRSRAIPVHPTLRQTLLAIARKSDGYVFHAARGGRLHPRNVLDAFISDVIDPLVAAFPTPPGEIGFEHGRLHGFRHFFCSQAFLGGASEGEIKEWLGHADSKMVEHYRHLRAEDAQRKMAKIDFLGRLDRRSGDVG